MKLIIVCNSRDRGALLIIKQHEVVFAYECCWKVKAPKGEK